MAVGKWSWAFFCGHIFGGQLVLHWFLEFWSFRALEPEGFWTLGFEGLWVQGLEGLRTCGIERVMDVYIFALGFESLRV